MQTPMNRPYLITAAIFISTSFTVPAQSFLTNMLTAYYPFNGNAQDQSGNGNHGTLNGATLTPDRFGNTNSAYAFEGVDDCIYIPEGLFSATNPAVTISLWIRTDNGDYSGLMDI